MTRGYLTPRERVAMLALQSGICCVVGCGSTGPLIGEHSTPNALKSGKPDQLMCAAHHREKTKVDIREIARAKRLSGETSSQYSRRQKSGPQIKSGGKLQGRGFDKRLMRRFDGTVIERKSR